MTYLVSTVETYRADTESEAATLISEAKNNEMYDLKKYSCDKKEVKAKGEIINEFFQVSLTCLFNDIKEPTSAYKVVYEE